MPWRRQPRPPAVVEEEAVAGLELNARYDLQTIEIMRRVLSPTDCCIDVGAHEGSILAHMVEFAPLGRHLAFEPIPAMAAELRRSFPQVEVHQVALGASNT